MESDLDLVRRFKCWQVIALVLYGFVQGSLAATPLPKSTLEAGDLIARRGISFWSPYFANASKHDKRFSHVGIVVLENGSPFVIHMEADDAGAGTAVKEPVSQYLSKATDWACFRLKFSIDKRSQIASAAETVYADKIPFNAAFDMNDSKRLYCTQMIWLITLKVTGIDITERKLTKNGVTILTIESVCGSKYVYQFETAFPSRP